MIKALEEAIEKIKGLSKERQEYAAEVLEHIALADDEVHHLEAGPQVQVIRVAEDDAGVEIR